MRIYLIGFMGCGKSTVGKKLAKKLGYLFVDLDEAIEQQNGKSISKIFEEEEGEKKFRTLESNTLKDISTKEEVVVATGGGTPCFNDNLQLMNETGITIYISMSHGSLFHRLAKSKAKRPLIKELSDIKLMDFIMDVLPFRDEFYSKALFTVKGEDIKVEKILELIKTN
ncbi:MAG: shikimate kinase [Bacteroidia bacterium]